MTASGIAADPHINFDAPILELPSNATTVEEMCLALRSGEAQKQYDAARYLEDQAKLGNTAPLAVDCLLFSLENGDAQTQSGYALVQYGEAAVPGLLDIVQKPMSTDPDIVKRNRRTNAYLVAVSMLRLLGPKAKDAESEMFRVMNNRYKPAHERLDAAQVVWAIGNPETNEQAYQVFLELVEKGDPDTRGFAAFALVRTLRAETLTHLIHCASRHVNRTWRRSCVTELGNIAAGLRQPLDPAEATYSLEQMKDDPDAEIRQHVESALEQVEWQKRYVFHSTLDENSLEEVEWVTSCELNSL